MIVMRAFDMLGGISVQCSVHVTCCRTGDCPEPDEVAYASQLHQAYEVDEVVPVIESLVHDLLSDAGGMLVSQFLQNHLERPPWVRS